MSKKIAYILAPILFLTCVVSASIVLAAEPTGDDWFQILTDHQTGIDNSGDGQNYYYVGQSFTGNIQIRSNSGTTASNIWIDYNPLYVSASGITAGTFFPSWSSQTISGGRIKSTGYTTAGAITGTGNFGAVSLSMIKPTAASYGTLNPATLDINTGTIGGTGESNISFAGADLLDSAEDFSFYIWADTVRPYAYVANPSGLTGLSTESAFSFILCDSKSGESADGGTCLSSGVGTGVNTATPPGYINVDDGTGAQSYTSYDSYSCSGTWATNRCDVSLNPPSPLAISGDQRKWKYGTSYTVTSGGFRDKASSSQNQLGDTNGPNTMLTKSWTFTTETDSVKPRVTAETPSRGSSGNALNTGITIDILDKKTYPGNISGTGVVPSSCRINVSSPSFSLTGFQQGSAGTTVTPIDYGYRFTLDPATDFGQNETVAVSVYNCTDSAGNVMITDNYTFTTRDSDTPYIDEKTPDNDQATGVDSDIIFHIKDSGSGVDLTKTVVYVNGVYYTNNGGSGSVTVNGTKITFGSSLNFNGGNYFGDTTTVTGSSGDRSFIINPQNSFVSGEAVPVIIYSQDLSGNIMERYVYAFSAGQASANGSSYCGSNTAWSGSFCIGNNPPVTQNDTICGAGDPASSKPEISESTINIVQIDESSVLVSWFSNIKSSSYVVYGKNPPKDYGNPPNYSYEFSTPETSDNSLYHSVAIGGLQNGTLYYFRPVSKAQGTYARGPELKMAPRFAVETKTETIKDISEKIIYQDRVVYQDRDVPQQCPTFEVPEKTPESENTGKEDNNEGDNSNGNIDNNTDNNNEQTKEFKISSAQKGSESIDLSGTAKPGKKIKITLYLAVGEKNIEYETSSDANGKWFIKINNSFAPGNYVVIAEDLESGQKESIVFYVPEIPGITQKTLDYIQESFDNSPYTAYPMAAAAATAAISFVSVISLAGVNGLGNIFRFRTIFKFFSKS